MESPNPILALIGGIIGIGILLMIVATVIFIVLAVMDLLAGKTRGRKIFRDVVSRKGRTALVSLAIFIGVAGTIALFSMSDIVTRQIREDIQEDDLAMMEIFATVKTGVTAPDDANTLSTLESVVGVSEVMGGVQNPVYVAKQSEVERANAAPDENIKIDYEDAYINSYTDSYEDGLRIEPLRLIEGEYPQEGEIALEQRMAEDFDLSVGDTLYFRVLSPSRDPEKNGEIGTLESRTVSGIVFHPYNLTATTSIYAATNDDADYLSGATGLNYFFVRFDDYSTADSTSDEVNNALATETDYLPIFSQLEDPEANQLITTAQTLGSTMSTLALIALLVSGFLVINVITSIVLEQKRQIGVMKSMGATRMDSYRMYSGIAFLYGLIGVIPGIIIGIPAGNAAAQALAPTLNTVLTGFQTSPGSIILGVIVGLIVPPFFALIPVFLGTRVKILDAMTDLGIDANYGTGFLAKVIAALPVPITVRQGFSNVSIKKVRLAFTVITLAIAAGAFMGIFAMFSSLTDGINSFLDIYNVQVAVFPTEPRPVEEIVAPIRENFMEGDDPQLISIEPGAQAQVEFEGYDPPLSAGGPPGIFAYAFDVTSENPAFRVNVDEGSPLTAENAEDGIILSSSLATGMEKGVGDKVIMKVPGNSVELTVVGISDFPLDQCFLAWQTLSRVAGYTIAPQPNQYTAQVTVDGVDAPVITLGMDDQVSGFLTFDDGEFFAAGSNEVIVSGALAESAGWSVGDTINVTGAAESGEFTVAGIFTLPPMMQSEDIPAEAMAMDFNQLVTLEGASLTGEPLPQGYWLTTTQSDPVAKDLDPLIDEINETMLGLGVPVQMFNFVELTDQISQIFTIIQVVLQAVAGLIGLVGALGLLTTLSMSVFERQKEIGVMRSIGASSSTVAGQFLTEGLVVGIIAWLIGLPLAIGIEWLLLTVTQFDETFPLVFPASAAILGLVAILIITFFASLLPSISASRKTVSDILRYQ